MFFIFPIRDSIPSLKKPRVTRAIVIINIVIYIFQFLASNKTNTAIIFKYGFIANRFTDEIFGGQFSVGSFYPFITSMFLHGGFIHLVGNMWILWIFGDNVEDRLGHFKFFVFYILSGVAAMGCHFIFGPTSPIPAIGASGAIAGVMGAYFILFPHARIITFIPIFIIPLFIRIPAVIHLGVWFILQVYSGALNSMGGSAGNGVAWWAHIGGFIWGILLLKIFDTQKHKRYPYYK